MIAAGTITVAANAEQVAGALLRHGTLKRNADGSHAAFILCVAHVAYETGKTPEAAVTKLRAALLRNLPRVMEAWEILGPVPSAPGRDVPLCMEG